VDLFAKVAYSPKAQRIVDLDVDMKEGPPFSHDDKP